MEDQVQVGWLVPLQENGEDEDGSIPIFHGSNAIGRNRLKNPHPQVSREHILLDASPSSVEISVTGSNPIKLKSGPSAKMLNPLSKSPLLVGDIIELLPGKLPFRYASYKGKTAVVKVQSMAPKKSVASNKPVTSNEPVASNISVGSNKRKRQIDEDEALARALQEMEEENPQGQEPSVVTSEKQHKKQDNNASDPNSILMRSAKAPCGFHLLRVRGLPEWANTNCVTVSDVIKGDVLVAILSNYMVDIEWLLSACPLLRSIPQVVMIHGQSNITELQAMKPSNWLLYKPPLRISYGTHHSKAMLLVYPTGVRVVVHTANLISVDWNNKSQGLWMQDFPFKSMTNNTQSSDFENDLVDYLTALEWSGCSINIEHHGEMKINAAYFRNFDYSNAAVRLVGSVPGYHSGRQLNKWGHMKLRTILCEQVFDQKFQKAPLVYQFSSLGSLDEKWMEEFASSMCEGSTNNGASLGTGAVQIVFPTVADVRESIEGYRAGSCIPSPAKNVDKPFLKRYWSRWQAEHTGRSRAMPHIKTYVRYRGNSLAWMCLTSANLSKAAWGALQKNKTQLMIRSYELGVVFLPSIIKKFKEKFSCTGEESSLADVPSEEQNLELCTVAATESQEEEKTFIRLSLPYALPPSPYISQDEPWSWDKEYVLPDVYGRRWPS